MTSVAILIGNFTYSNLNQLPCCEHDVEAISSLINETKKYADTIVLKNSSADNTRLEIREMIDRNSEIDELFFYFSGHGMQNEADFFLCSPDFDEKSPNQTGLSNTELHALLRSANSELVVKVTDACNSGTILVKTGTGFLPQPKDAFKKIIQISSCLETQNSVTGDPLSEFTEKFIGAALRKTTGEVFYTDIQNILRDEYLENMSRTPFFVFQSTGRECFVTDAKLLDGLRKDSEHLSLNGHEDQSSSKITLDLEKSLRWLLEEKQAQITNACQVETVISKFTETLKSELSSSEFSDFFDMKFDTEDNYNHSTSEAFIIRVLNQEERTDNFVTAKITSEPRNRLASMGFSAFAALRSAWGSDQDIKETYTLKLNYPLQIAQVSIKFVPKFSALLQIVLTVSFAPSLEKCYIFEVVTQSRLLDFEKYDPAGTESVKRWYQIGWNEDLDKIPQGMSEKIKGLIRDHLKAIEERLNKGK